MPSLREAQLRYAAYYRTILSVANQLYLQGGDAISRGLVLFDQKWANIRVGQACAAELAPTTDAVAQLCSNYVDVGRDCLALRLHMQEWIRWLEAALASARRLQDRRREGYHLGNPGTAYKNLGEREKAISYMEAALQIFETIDLPYAEIARQKLAQCRKQPTRKRGWKFWK